MNCPMLLGVSILDRGLKGVTKRCRYDACCVVIEMIDGWEKMTSEYYMSMRGCSLDEVMHELVTHVPDATKEASTRSLSTQ